MKPSSMTLIIALSGLIAAGSGCGKKEEPKSDMQKQVESTATAVKQATDKAASSVSETATKAAQTVKEEAATTKPAVADANAQVQSLIDTAKKLVADGNWQEATKKLESLTGLKLSTEQQSLVDQLKQQIKQLEAGTGKLKDDANKAVGNLLKK